MADAADDPFSSLHSLEENFYEAGYSLGVADGSRAGRIEGRIFGLEKGFEKFLDLGRMAGRANVWVERLPNAGGSGGQTAAPASHSAPTEGSVRDAEVEMERLEIANARPRQEERAQPHLPLLSDSARLEKHVQTVWALVEPATFSTQNTEEAVADFDDRYKRATAKAKVVEKIIGEPSVDDAKMSLETNVAKKRDIRVSREQKAEKNMEDFGALVK